MSAAALAVYGDPSSLAAAVGGLDGLARELLLAAGWQNHATADALTCWHGEAADAFLAAQVARDRDVLALLDHVQVTRGALETLARELAAARAGVRRVIEAADELGLRVRDDARAVYLPADFSALHPDALAAPEEAARLTRELTAIYWRAQEAWGSAAGRLRSLHPEPMPSHKSLLDKARSYAWSQLPGVLIRAWLAPLSMAEALAERDPAAADAWARKQKLPRLGKFATIAARDLKLLEDVPGLSAVTVLGGALSVWTTKQEINRGTDKGVAVLANSASTFTSAGVGGAVMLLMEASPPGRAIVVAGFLATGAGSIVHWALETDPVQRVIKGVESAVSSGFRRLARGERAAMDALARAG